MAAMMSSIDSALNSASTLVTMDFFKKLRPQTTSVQLMWIGRAVTFVFMLAAAAWAPQIDKFPTLWQYLQTWVFRVQCLAASIDSSEFCIKFGHWKASGPLLTKYVDASIHLL